MTCIDKWLEEENEFLKETYSYLVTQSKAVFKGYKDSKDNDFEELKVSYSQNLSQLNEKMLLLEADITKKDEIINSQKKKIAAITAKHNTEVKSHMKAQKFLTECQNMISSLEEQLNILAIHSDTEKKKLETMCDLLRQEVNQKSVKCSKLRAKNQILQEDKENCEIKLRRNEKATKELSKRYRKENNIINQKMVNTDVQHKQMKFLSELNSQPMFL